MATLRIPTAARMDGETRDLDAPTNMTHARTRTTKTSKTQITTENREPGRRKTTTAKCKNKQISKQKENTCDKRTQAQNPRDNKKTHGRNT